MESPSVSIYLSTSEEEEEPKQAVSKKQKKAPAAKANSRSTSRKRKITAESDDDGKASSPKTNAKAPRRSTRSTATKKRKVEANGEDEESEQDSEAETTKTKKTTPSKTSKKGKGKEKLDDEGEDYLDEEEDDDGEKKPTKKTASKTAAKKGQARSRKRKATTDGEDEDVGESVNDAVIDENVQQEVEAASGRWVVLKSLRIPLLLKWRTRNHSTVDESELKFKVPPMTFNCYGCGHYNSKRTEPTCSGCGSRAPWNAQVPYHEARSKALAKAKEKKELEAQKAFMKTPLPDIDSFKKPFAATILRGEHSYYDVYELRDAKQQPVGRLEGFASAHHSTITELRKVLKEMQGEPDEAETLFRARRTPKKDKKRAVWGDEKDKFSSSKLWKTKWSILPREEKIPEEWIADKYHGMWSKQTDTPEQFKDQWESGAIRMAQFALKLDVGRFEAMVKNGLPITTRNLVFELIWQAGRTHAVIDCMTEKDKSMEMFENNCPTVPLTHRKQPARIQTKLYGYQLNALAWMNNLENTIKEGKGFSVPKLTKVDWTDIQFNTLKKRFLLPTEKKEALFYTKGGIYADEMGLGKTITMLSLVLANPLDLTRPPAVDDSHFVTKATLILAPNHLVKQWTDEIRKNIKPSLDVLVLTTIVQCQKVTYRDVMKADVVIVSFQLLKNKIYLQLGCIDNHGPLDIVGRQCEVKTSAQELKRRVNPFMQTCPILEHFFWHRLIVDEGHEVLCDDYAQKRTNFYIHAINNLQSSYRWYVSGTPLPHARQSLNGALRFLQSRIPRALTNPVGELERRYFETIRRNIFWRNTKASIGDEYNIPEIVEQLIFLEPSEVELGMYEDAKRNHDTLRMRQLCCHMQISEIDRRVLGIEKKTLDDIRKEMIAHKQDEERQAVEQLRDVEAEERQTRIELREATGAYVKQSLKTRLSALATSIASYKKDIANYRATLAYFESIIPQVSRSAEEPCVICFETITQLTITPCGHMYCRACIESALGVASRCPTCRNPLTRGQLTQVLEEEQKEAIEEKHEVSGLIQKYGTKMAQLIKLLGELLKKKDNRIIIFSQWDGMLHKVGDTLKENHINNVYVRGNVWQRNKAIGTFKESEDEDPKSSRVIMLSLEKAASGTNLTEATHIILLDPVSGKPEEIAAIESQAIGRAHRQGQNKQLTLIRLIMKNTIEHEIYERNSTVIAEAKQAAANSKASASSTSSSTSSSSSSAPTVTKLTLDEEEDSSDEDEMEVEKEEKGGKAKESSDDEDEDEVEDEKEKKTTTATKKMLATTKNDNDDEEEEQLNFTQLYAYSVAELKAHCQRLGVTQYGRSRKTITDALLAFHKESSKKDEGAEEEEDDDGDEGEAKEKADSDESEEEEAGNRIKLDVSNLGSHTMEELRAFRAQEGIRGGGRSKAALIQSIADHLARK